MTSRFLFDLMWGDGEGHIIKGYWNQEIKYRSNHYHFCPVVGYIMIANDRKIEWRTRDSRDIVGDRLYAYDKNSYKQLLE